MESTKPFIWSERSRRNLQGVHPDLRRLASLALARSPVDFTVIEGLRTRQRQEQLLLLGATRTLKSKHLTGHAIDVAAIENGVIRWDWPLYRLIAAAFKEAARANDIALTWGGDWPRFKDGPHFEIDPKRHP